MYFNRLLLKESRTIIEIADRLYLLRHTKAAEYTVTELLQRVSLGIYIALKSVYNLDFDNFKIILYKDDRLDFFVFLEANLCRSVSYICGSETPFYTQSKSESKY